MFPDNHPDESASGSDTWGSAPPFVPPLPVDESEANFRFRGDLRRLSAAEDPLLSRGRLGRFQLRRLIGRGGMGTVYAADDPLHDRSVALKILHPALRQQPEVLRRFRRESRLLSQIDSDFVTRLYEIGEADGQIYLVQELVEGQTLAELIHARKQLTERQAVGIGMQIASALVVLHTHGIVHRDVKPDNILICPPAHPARTVDQEHFAAKLTDLGVARQEHVAESVAVTSAQSLLGTPLYMSPEQFYGGTQVNEQSDLYSLGATLFHAMTGRPPFQEDSALALADSHRHSPVPRPQSLNAALSDGISGVILKALQKRADLRYASADEFLLDLQKLDRGEVTSVLAHPVLPDAGRGQMLSFSFAWELSCTPEQLWPYVSNTERLNRAIGLPAVQFSIQSSENSGREQLGEFKLAGMRMLWREHAFEWVEAQKMSVLREYHTGPLFWMTSVVEFTRRPDGGSRLTHSFKICSRHLPGALFVRFQMHAVTRPALERVYRRIDTVLRNSRTAGSLTDADAFEETRPLKSRPRRRLEQIIEQLSQQTISRDVLLKVTDFVRSAAAQDVSRIRPRWLARRLGLPAPEVIDVCLRAVQQGLFRLSWDVICPSCRIASGTADTIAEIRRHARCEACNFDFEVSFGTGVELILRTSDQIRRTENRLYCVGGPAHSPHVVAQTRVAAAETVQLGLELSEGEFVIRGPQLPFTVPLQVRSDAPTKLLLLNLSPDSEKPGRTQLTTETQLLTIVNPTATEVTVRVERCVLADDAVTALQAAALPYFRRFFPDQIPSAAQIAARQELCFVVITNSTQNSLVAHFGELAACELIDEHLKRLTALATRCGGTFVRSVGEGGLLVFPTVPSAILAVNQGPETVPRWNQRPAWQPVIAIRQGSAMVTTVDGRVEYLGSVVTAVQSQAANAQPGEILADPELLGQITNRNPDAGAK